MWPQWLRSPRENHSAPNTPRSLSCSSFKDIHILRKDSQSRSMNSNSNKPGILHRVRMLSFSHWNRKNRNDLSLSKSFIATPDDHRRHQCITIYFTSLHTVRRTYEDCKTVRSILLEFRVPIDERDLSMDATYIDELHEILGSKSVKLPSVFIGGRYLGGVEDIKELHETGELKRMIRELPHVDPNICDVCGGFTFVLCDRCNGSHKIYCEDICRFLPCTNCNRNGLIKCPSCCSTVVAQLSENTSK